MLQLQPRGHAWCGCASPSRSERQRADEELDAPRGGARLPRHPRRRSPGLPNRTLILDRVEQMLRRAAPQQDARRGAVHRPRQLQGDQRHARPRRRRRAAAARSPRGSTASSASTDALGRLGGDEFVVDRRGALARRRPGAGRRAPARSAQRAVRARRRRRHALSRHREHRHRRPASATSRRGAAARRRHRDVPRQVGRQEPLRRLRVRDAGRRSSAAWSSRWTCAKRSTTSEFFLVYQPTFDLADDDARPGVEALIRWQQPDARRRPARRLHPAARGDRADRRGRRAGCSTRPAAQGAAWQRGRAPTRHRGQRLRPPARHRRADRPTSSDALERQRAATRAR